MRSCFLRGMASKASRGDRRHGIDVIPWRNRRQHPFRHRQLLRVREMALLTIPAVSGIKYFIVVDAECFRIHRWSSRFSSSSPVWILWIMVFM